MKLQAFAELQCVSLAKHHACVAAGWKFEPMEQNPMFGPSAAVLFDLGAKDTELIVRGGEPWRLGAAMWLHAGLIHLASNMYGLLQAGFPAEKVHGWWKVLVLYLLSGLMGNIVSSIFLPTSVTVGASGAVFGLFGAMWGDFCQNYNLYKGGRSPPAIGRPAMQAPFCTLSHSCLRNRPAAAERGCDGGAVARQVPAGLLAILHDDR